jgi:hypothetical protein
VVGAALALVVGGAVMATLLLVNRQPGWCAAANNSTVGKGEPPAVVAAFTRYLAAVTQVQYDLSHAVRPQDPADLNAYHKDGKALAALVKHDGCHIGG